MLVSYFPSKKRLLTRFLQQALFWHNNFVTGDAKGHDYYYYYYCYNACRNNGSRLCGASLRRNDGYIMELSKGNPGTVNRHGENAANDLLKRGPFVTTTFCYCYHRPKHCGDDDNHTDNNKSSETNCFTLSEWQIAHEMISNIAAVSCLPTALFSDHRHRHVDDQTLNDVSHPGIATVHSRQCRHCLRDNETLGHILGSCPYSAFLRNRRHHRIRTLIADAFRQRGGAKVFEEVPCRAVDGSNRRIDILVIDTKTNAGLLLDPTIRVETTPLNHLLLRLQSSQVDAEKKRIYEPCVPHLISKYGPNLETVEVQGLFFGAQGAIPESFIKFCQKHRLPSPQDIVSNIAFSIIRDSATMLNSHLFGR